MNETSEDRIKKYYNSTRLDYFWALRQWKHNNLHYGYFDGDTKGIASAILNLNRVLADKVNIQEGDKVLDAGSGDGGSSVWLATHRGANVLGLTLVESQVQRAQALARRKGVANTATFKVGDFRKTGLKDKSFDVLWAIESVCHAENKNDFVREAFRILRHGGRLILSDGFVKKEGLSPSEEFTLKKWLDGWAVPNLASFKEFKKLLAEAGFQDIQVEDATEKIRPFSLWLYRRARLAYPLGKILQWLHIRSPIETGNIVAAINQLRSIDSGVWGYGIFFARKP